MRGQEAFGAFVCEVVADVGEKSTARFECAGGLHRLLDRGVGGVRLVPESVEEENVESAQEFH